MSKLIAFLYKFLKVANDVNAVSKGKIGKRVARRTAGKFTQKLFNKAFR